MTDKSPIMQALADYSEACQTYKQAQELCDISSDTDNCYGRNTARLLCQMALEDVRRTDNAMKSIAEYNSLQKRKQSK